MAVDEPSHGTLHRTIEIFDELPQVVEQFLRIHGEDQGIGKFETNEIVVFVAEDGKGKDGIGVIRGIGIQRCEEVGVICTKDPSEITQTNSCEPRRVAQQSGRRVEVVRLLDDGGEKNAGLVKGRGDSLFRRVSEKIEHPLRHMIPPLFHTESQLAICHPVRICHGRRWKGRIEGRRR